jgi:tellurite resistance protein
MPTVRPLLASLLVLGGPALARVGGGQHYSSPSHASPSHSSSHSATTSRSSSFPTHPPGSGYVYSRGGVSPSPLFVDPFLVIAFIVLAVVLFVLLRRIFGASAVTQRALQQRDAIAQLDIAPAERESWVSALQSRDPAFTERGFLERVQSLFRTTQEAWSAGELLPVRRFLSDATWLRFRLQLALLRAQGVRNVTADVEVTDLVLVGFEQNAWFDTLHVAIEARARDADVPVDWPETKALAAVAHASAEAFTEVWSLVRKPGVRSSTDAALAALTCPNCGAPFEGGAASTCPYCKAVVNSGAYDWVLAEITQAVEIARGNAEVPGLEELRVRDPALSLEVLEDRASLVFWRWIEAQSTGQPERLARVALPGPVDRMRADIERLTAQHLRRVFLECAVGDVSVRAFEESTDGRTLAHIEIRWSARMGVGPLGRTPPSLPMLPQRWVFTLTRARDAATRAEQGMSTDRCGQCGGPLADGLAANCPWCQTLLAGDLRDWTLAEACPLEAWEGRARSGEPSALPSADLLPDLEERERLLYTMAAMAMADGQVDARERRMLLQCAERWGLPSSHVDLALAAGPASLESLLPTRHAGEPFLRALAQLAGVDGRVDSSERRMLESVASRLGLTQRLPALLASVGAT